LCRSEDTELMPEQKSTPKDDTETKAVEASLPQEQAGSVDATPECVEVMGVDT